MTLGPGHPTWTALYDALAELALACGGSFAFVLDEGNGLWCVGIADEAPTTNTLHANRFADRFYGAEVVPRLDSIRRGVSWEAIRTEPKDRYVALSFAGIYVLVVAFDTEVQPQMVRARMRRALPAIEALTLALPPSGGPGSEAAARRA